MPRLLYHWTPRRTQSRVRREGLRSDLALGSLKAVWACSRSKIGWALSHVAARHGFTPDEFVLVQITVPRRQIRKSCWRGVYTCKRGYGPERIRILGGIECLTGVTHETL